MGVLMKLYVISLKRSVERRDHVRGQLDPLPLEYEFFDALDGSVGHEAFFDRYDERRYLINCGRRATPGEIGCYASHLALWRLCVELDQPILILEDDFQLTTQFLDAVTLCNELIEQYGFIRLQEETRARRQPVLERGEFTLCYYSKAPHSLMCYALHPSAARKLISQAKVLDAPVDVMVKMSWRHRQRLYGLVPYTALDSDHSHTSTIGFRGKHPKPPAVALQRFFTKVGWLWHACRINHQLQ
jgi:glycosyl transferase, family 25